MKTVKVPLFSEIYRNIDDTVGNDVNWSLVNGYRDEKGGINSRPGSNLVDTFHSSGAAPVNGIYWWDKRGLMFVSAGDRLYSLSFNGASYSKVNLTTDVLQTTGITSFANDGTNLYAANGGRIVYTNGTSATTYIADTDAPTAVTCIGWLDGYLLALNKTDSTIYFSEVNDAATWSALDYFLAPGNPDDIIEFRIHNRDIYLFGTASIEIWENDGETPFSRAPGGFIQVGCIAAKSVVQTESALYWLDSNRRFSVFAGNQPQVISSPFDRELQTFANISGCVGVRLVINGADFIIWNFPSQDRSLVYNVNLQDWTEWGTWIPATNSYRRYFGQAAAFSPAFGKILGGAYDVPNVYEISPDYLTDNGTSIRLVRRSGHIDYGSSKFKRGEEFRMRVRRGDDDNSSTSPPEVTLRWRDNNRPTWSNDHVISLGAPGSSDMIYRALRTGMYRTRQYEISTADAARLVMADAEEDVELLR